MSRTPGPWEYDAESMQVIAPKCGYHWAQSVAVVAEIGRLDYDEPEANARLIAAAPELLSALNAMLTHMGMDEDEWTKPTFNQARAAIRKATGEQA
jgi:hypothetical protein